MDFTWLEYGRILNCLKEHEYMVCDYKNYSNYPKSVILRHDVDVSLSKAYEMALFEKENNVTSTYFVLITGDMYNAFTRKNIEYIKKIQDLGHGIGLHFDETVYPEDCDMVGMIEQEIFIMRHMLNVNVDSVSMHIPSQKTLEANYVIEGGNIVNSYSDVFFKEFKYVSDSAMRWREDIYSIIESEKYSKIHLLTHPIWYNENNLSMWENISKVLSNQARESYENLGVHTVGVKEKRTLKECLGEIYDRD